MIVGDHDNRGAAGIELLDESHDVLAGLAIQVSGRFVSEDDVGRADQRSRDRDPLPFATRELGRFVAHPMGEADLSQSLLCEGPSVAQGHARIEQSIGDVVQRRLSSEEEELLKDEPDVTGPQRRELLVVEIVNVVTGDRDRARCCSVERADHMEERRLPRSRWADDGDQLPSSNIEIEAANCVHGRCARIRFRDVREGENRAVAVRVEGVRRGVGDGLAHGMTTFVPGSSSLEVTSTEPSAYMPASTATSRVAPFPMSIWTA